MNKAVKKIVSLVVAMTFMLTIAAVPVSFAAINATPTDTYGWRIDLFADLNADGTGKTPITALAPNQEAYVQFVLTGLKYLRSAQGTLTATNASFVAMGAADSKSKAAFENFKTSPAIVGANILAINDTFTGFSESSANFGIANPPLNENFPTGEGVYATTNTNEGTDVVLMTYKIKAAADVSATKIVGVTVSNTEFNIGEKDPEYGDRIPTDVPAANQKNLGNVGLPTVKENSTVTLVDAEKNTVTDPTIKTLDNNSPFEEGDAPYYFRAELTNGAPGDFRITDAPVDANAAMKAFVSVNSYKLADNETSKEISITSVTLVDKAMGINTTKTVAIKVLVQGAEYRVKAAQTIELPRGVKTVDAATILPYIEKTVNGGADNWNAAVQAADITATEITFNTEAGQPFDNMAAVNTPTVVIPVIDGMTFKSGENNKLTIKTIAATPKSPAKYQVKADQAFTLYLSSNAFDGDIIMEQEYSDGFTGHDVSAKSLSATIDASAIDALLADKENEVTDTAAAVKVTIGGTEYTGSVKVTTKKALPLEKYMAAADDKGTIQEIGINYKGNVDVSKIKFWEEVQLRPGDETSNTWVAYTPAADAITLSNFDNTKDGEYTVTVSVAGIELDPATIKVVVKKVATYSAAWSTTEAPKLAVGATDADIIDMLLFTADYSGVKEAVELTGVTLTGYDPTATDAQTVKVMYDGKEIGSLAITLVANASNATADLPVAGIELVGKLTTVMPLEAGKVDLTVAANSASNIKLLATVTGVDEAKDYPTTVNFPGFAPVDVTIKVTAEGEATVEMAEGAKLVAGYVAKANGDTADKADINDNDFYAIAASLGEENVAPDSAKAKYDLNRDGKITELDIEAVLSNLGTQVK